MVPHYISSLRFPSLEPQPSWGCVGFPCQSSYVHMVSLWLSSQTTPQGQGVFLLLMASTPCIAIHSKMIMAMAVTSCLADGLLCTETKFSRLSTRQGLIKSTLLALLRGQAGIENTLENKFIARGKNADPSSGLPGACPEWANAGSQTIREDCFLHLETAFQLAVSCLRTHPLSTRLIAPSPPLPFPPLPSLSLLD